MKSRVFSRRILVLASMNAAALVLGRVVPAQGVVAVESGAGLEQMADSPSSDSVRFAFEGVVLSPDGAPAEGAVRSPFVGSVIPCPAHANCPIAGNPTGLFAY